MFWFTVLCRSRDVLVRWVCSNRDPVSTSSDLPGTIKRMPRTDIYIKVTVQHDHEESPEKLAAELLRQLKKIYVVRNAEMTNFVSRSEE